MDITLSPQKGRSSTMSESPSLRRDTGPAAWKALCGAILFDGLLVGFPLTFGVFQQYFHSHNTFRGSVPSAWIGVLATGVPFLGAPFVTYLCQKQYFRLRYYLLAGWLICVVALVAASFCKSLLSLALTQGLCYGAGIFILDVPVLLIVNTWFLNRRGLAYGILFAMTDLFGFGQTFLANALLSKYGLKITLLSFAAIVFAVPGAAIWLLKEHHTEPEEQQATPSPAELPQLPIPEQSCGTDAWDGNGLIYYQRPIFYILTLSNLLQSFAFYLPFIYLPSFTTDLGHSPTEATTILAIANLAQIIGEVAFGKLSDLINVRGLCVLSSCLGASLATLLLWGLARSYVQLIFFAIIYGAFASGLISLWARIGTFFGEKDAQNIYSVMSFGRGIGNVASGPTSAALLAGKGKADRSLYALGKYRGVVLFVGICMGGSALLGGLGFFAVAREERVQREKDRVGGP